MKTTFKIIVLSLLAASLALSCSDFITPSSGPPPGTALIRIGDISAKAIVPSVTVDDFDLFRLEFTDDAKPLAEGINPIVISNLTPQQVRSGVSVALEQGINWKVKAKAYILGLNNIVDNVVIPAAVSSGEDVVYIFGGEESKPVIVNLVLNINQDGANGWLSWETDWLMLQGISLGSAVLSVYEPGTTTAIKTVNMLNPGGESISQQYNSQGVSITNLSLASGYYRIALDVTGNGTSSYGLSELVHIFSNLDTRLPFKVEDILGFKPLSGTFVASGVTSSSSLSGMLSGSNISGSVRLTAMDLNGTKTYGSPISIPGSSIGGYSWRFWVPIGVESAKIKVEFLNSSGNVLPNQLSTDVRTVTGIDVRGKDQINLFYNGTYRTITTNLSGASGSSVVTYVSSFDNTRTISTGSSGNYRFFSGLTLGIKVNYPANTILDGLRVSWGSGASAVSIDVLDEFGGNPSMATYNVVVEASANITVNAAFRSTSGVKPAIVCFGDSITYGIGEGNWGGDSEDPTKTYPGYLRTKLNLNNVQVINSGFDGYRYNDGIWELDWAVLTYNPSHVIVNFGINDVLQEYVFKVPQSNFANTQLYLNEMVRKLVDGKRTVYVAKFMTEAMLRSFLESCNVPADRREEVIGKYTALFASLPVIYGPTVKVIENIWQDVWGQGVPWNYKVHGVHPGVSGYQVMANNIYNAIQSDLPANYKL